ncbi:MAG TPA: 16S rRNA (cytidine(1402)-2'-O)-methyltransferase [Gemmatimonadaceae bacterium]|nr:16S rRNA (cytidine(1402)-2'-O)-methyltransferase [Gemmatimonadaceae bacterium]
MSSAKADAAASADAAGTLYLVSTPIGNLGDMSRRAVEVLSSAALIIAEDTRHSRRLLDHYRIATRVSSYHEHNEAKETPRLVTRLRAGDSIALISDAGTPLISDPGSRLVAAALEAKVPVVPIPGPSSVMAALVGSGMPLERFSFFGFLPRKGSERAEMIGEIVDSRVTVVLFEAANRVAATLEALREAGAGARPAVVARELTKQFEEFKRGSIADLSTLYSEADPKGEVVLVIGGAESPVVAESELNDAAKKLRASGKPPRDVMDHLVSALGASRNVAYRIAHERES